MSPVFEEGESLRLYKRMADNGSFFEALVVPPVDFDTTPYGVNTNSGIVDGRYVGPLTASLIAIRRHASEQEYTALIQKAKQDAHPEA